MNATIPFFRNFISRSMLGARGVDPVRFEPKTGGSVDQTEPKARSLGCYFAATEVLAKHDEKYMPSEVAAALEKNKKLLAEQEKEKIAEEALVNADASSNAGAAKA